MMSNRKLKAVGCDDRIVSSASQTLAALASLSVGDIAVFPGFCDVHVHFREPGFSYKETIFSGSLAAAHGGYTAVCTMPNLDPVPDSKQNVKQQTDLIRQDGLIHIYPYGAITVGQQGKQLSLSITNPNAGQPVPQEELAHLFDRFYRTDTARSGELTGEVRAAVNKMLNQELAFTVELIGYNRAAIDALVQALLEKNQLTGPEIDQILKEHAVQGV